MITCKLSTFTNVFYYTLNFNFNGIIKSTVPQNLDLVQNNFME